ncbi:hypothetical protein [Paraburkholderia acidisoli]|uniref:Uncharacterized protein n=1 Tax=Paraburkholderia acidisoli TaxID=2571748 RepID=A0A7Z2JHK4_9BURK|nr:hypothetical protein [Paraburkholderia acidisoli]QGZ65857.1 hypothetical protein FAZ98_28875 [Paraburkholderia acidisoli]
MAKGAETPGRGFCRSAQSALSWGFAAFSRRACSFYMFALRQAGLSCVRKRTEGGANSWYVPCSKVCTKKQTVKNPGRSMMDSKATSAVMTGQDSTLNAATPVSVASAFLSPAAYDDRPEETGRAHWGAAALSGLSFCIAWLFGLEAFFAEPAGGASSTETRGRSQLPRQ